MARGAVVRIVRSWGSEGTVTNEASFTVSCEADPAALTVDTSELRQAAPMRDLDERCRQAEASLRVPPSGNCPPLAKNVTSTPAPPSGLAETDSDYLQQRATALQQRIDLALTQRKLSKKQAAQLHLTVGRVQTLAGNLQACKAMIARPDADRMNQELTDVERALPMQQP